MGLQFFAWQQEPTPKQRPRQRPNHGTAMVAFTATVSQPGEVMALAMATARGLLMLMLSPRLMLTSDMVDSTAMVLVWAMAATAMEALATDMERGLLMLRPSPRPMLTSDMVDSTAMVLVRAMAAMAMEVSAMDMERGLLMLRPNLRLMPVWAMAAMVMEVLVTDTARGPLRLSPKPMPTSDMGGFMAMVLAWATAAMAMEVLAPLMERGPLTPSLRPMPGMDTVASTATDSQPMAVMATDCGERSKHYQKHRLIIICNKPMTLIGLDP